MAYLDGNEILFSPQVVFGTMATVDQEYNPESTNAQSGKAVAQKFAKTSQGNSAKYNITTPGWKRILNIIRATNGAIDIGLASGNPYRMVQALAFDITGFVKYPTDTSDSKPVVIKRYENTFGQDDAVNEHPFKVSKIRVGYPKAGTDFPNTDGATDYTVNPVNCYVDIYVDFASKNHRSLAFNMNYAGFAESHNCLPIREETTVDDSTKGIYGEELEYYEVSVEKMPYYVSTEQIYSGSAAGYGVKMHSNGFLSIDQATEGEITKGTNKYKPITAANIRTAIEHICGGKYISREAGIEGETVEILPGIYATYNGESSYITVNHMYGQLTLTGNEIELMANGEECYFRFTINAAGAGDSFIESSDCVKRAFKDWLGISD